MGRGYSDGLSLFLYFLNKQERTVFVTQQSPTDTVERAQMSDHDLLIRLEVKINMLFEEFRRTSNGTGFPRCAERLERLESLESSLKQTRKDFESLTGKCWWAVTFAVTSLTGFASAVIVFMMKGALG
jgi:hypothetical protein